MEENSLLNASARNTTSLEMENSHSCEILSISPVQSPVYDQISDETVGMRLQQTTVNQDPLPSFVCLGEPEQNCLKFQSDSYLKRGELNKILRKKDPSCNQFVSRSLEMFGFNFVAESCLTDCGEQLFRMAKQIFMVLEEHSSGSTRQFTLLDGSSREFGEKRMEVVKFLSYLKWYFITCVSAKTTVNEILPILKQLKSLLVTMGRIANSTNYTTLQQHAKRNSITSVHHLFHLHLDAAWSISALLYCLPSSISSAFLINLTDDINNAESQNLFLQYTKIVLWDLVLLAMKKFHDVSLHSYINISPFTCCCVRELWILLRHLLDDSQKQRTGSSFWSLTQIIFQNILYEKLSNKENSEINSDVFSAEPLVNCSDRIGFCWWLLLHLSRLYKIDASGDVQTALIRSNYTLLQTLIAITVQSEKMNEPQLRCYLRCCVEICRLWEPNGDVLLPLVTYFIQHMNSNFCLPYSLDGFESLCQSGHFWLTQIKSRVDGCEKNASDNSFHLFLGLISLQLNRIVIEGRNKEWNLFKDRLLAKFNSRKVQELNDVGLHNLSSLLLTLAYLSDFEDIASRLCAFFDMIPSSSLSSNQRMTMWCSLFVLLGICREHKIDMSFVANKLSSAFNNVTAQLKNVKMDSMERNQTKKMILLYVNGVEEIIDRSSDLSLSEYLLINVGIYNSLKNFDCEEIEQIMAMIHIVLNKLRMISAQSNRSASAIHQHKALAQILCKHVLPFVNQHCITQTPPEILPDVAAGLTAMIADMSSLNVSESFASTFLHFGVNSEVSPVFSCRYLCHVLPQQKMMKTLLQGVKNVQYQLIGSWFRSLVFLPENNRYILELTRLILKLSEMESFDINSGGDEKIAIQVLRSLRVKFDGIQSFSEKMTFRQKTEIIFKDIMKHNESTLKNFEPLDQLRQLYQITSNIVKFCSPIVYVKSKADGLLHSVTHQLLLPRIIYCHDKPLPPNLPIVLKENLHLFIEGLFNLNPRRDTCLNNRLKDIVIQYIFRFHSTKSKSVMTNAVNPLMHCLQNYRMLGLEEFFVFALEAIRDQINSKNNQQILTVVHFVFILISSATDESQTLTSQTLLVPFMLLLTHNDPKMKDAVYVILRKLLRVFKKSEETRAVVKPQMKNFLQEQMLHNANRLFRNLNVLMDLDLRLVKDLMVDVVQAIEYSENKRGVGQDATLRNLQRELLEKLGSRDIGT